MQVLHGMATETMRVSEMAQQVPRKLLRFLLRLSQLKAGRYVIIYSVGSDKDVQWQVSEVGQVER